MGHADELARWSGECDKFDCAVSGWTAHGIGRLRSALSENISKLSSGERTESSDPSIRLCPLVGG